MKKFLTLFAMMVCAVSLYAKDLKVLVVTTTPKMQCENCENRIKKNLRFEKGVKKIETNLKNQLVIVTYDADKTNEKNIEDAFSKLDYKIEVLPMEVTSSVAIGFSGKDKACCKEKTTCNKQSVCTKKDCTKTDCTKTDCTRKDCTKTNCTKKDCTKKDCTKKDCTKKDCTKTDCTRKDCTKTNCTKTDCTKTDCPKGNK